LGFLIFTFHRAAGRVPPAAAATAGAVALREPPSTHTLSSTLYYLPLRSLSNHARLGHDAHEFRLVHGPVPVPVRLVDHLLQLPVRQRLALMEWNRR